MSKLPCQKKREIFDNTSRQNEAKAVCAGCHALTSCLKTALANDERWGVWGGLTPNERWQLTHKDGSWIDYRGTLRLPCGTETSLKRHRGLREQCAVCEEADRRRRLDVEHALPGGGSRSGAQLHRMLGEEPCEACQMAFVEAAKLGHASRRAQVAA
ncbi:WhiB family transcriptional regulator [Streptomyces lydicus]|uniref:WhiB family transcriptional regulator n=1 Tax=Streptomyces lydicus TaxID=47763 RepID=UPI0037B84917